MVTELPQVGFYGRACRMDSKRLVYTNTSRYLDIV